MYFKKLEIVGFKSFLNKTKLKFEPGVTAIVGPNGCGKSNIVDSIKWVLGEQSAKSMRSSSMQDVIFNGTEQYEPVNVAEVSLTLSNTDKQLPVDYDEVVISRRIYRSGESEYLLNKMPVRLADIRNIIMGTGMGTSAYSVVEQGRMDMILSSKPEDRRYVFEEASGITRYKAKKREAMLKLEHTEENLTRLNDIILEVERQIKSIERQARKAERYKMRYDELKTLETKSACKKFKELTDSASALGAEEGNLKNLILTLDSQIKELSFALSNEREKHASLVEELSASESKIMRLTTDIDKNEHTIAVNTERIEELEKRIERLDCEIENGTERRLNVRTRVEALEVRFQDVRTKRQARENEFAALEEAEKAINAQIEGYKRDLMAGRGRSLDITSDQTKSKNALIKINADTQNALSRKRRLSSEMQHVQEEIDAVKNQLGAAEENIENVKTELERTKGEFDAFNKEFMSKQENLLCLNDQRREWERKINEIIPRRQFFEKLLTEREGINESVKGIMRHVEQGDKYFSGVHGILSELINIQEGYGESIESLLGDAAQSIVVDTSQTADKIIGYLAGNSLGSVNFVILEELKKLAEGVIEPDQDKDSKESFGNITNVLRAKEPYCSALRTLLYDVYVALSSEAAKTVMGENNDFYGCLIGPKGEIFQKGMHRSRNYSSKEVIPLFGRRERIEELRKNEEEISREIEAVTQTITGLEAWVRNSIGTKERLESDMREKELRFTDASGKKTAIKDRVDSLNEEMLLVDTETKEEDENIRHFDEERARLDQVLKDLESENARLEAEMQEHQRLIQEAAEAREGAFLKMSDLKAELSAFSKEEENLAENVEREKESHGRMEQEVEVKRREINENGDNIRRLTEEVRLLGEQNTTFGGMVETANKDIAMRKEAKERMAANISSQDGTLRTKQEELENAKNKTRDLDIRKKELEYKQSAVVEKMLNSYKINISELNMELAPEVNWDEEARMIEELKDQLDKMGEVSLGAVEEHKELEQRYQFLTKQRDDLAAAKETLMKAVVKINRTTREMFMETFEKVKVQFNDYFRMLFNGGRAELVLEDESNVLECGIDIVVRPPGKKLHNILQLSGGEKAMTAIALIFAIFKVTPSPFCILDEIDAPLDESNIVRFCRVLQEFLKTSQFIIVTHNRMTIQLADVLYGITMQEKGVSKIVSVKFAEGKEASPDKETVPAAA